MKNEINAVLENMTTTIPEPEDYTGEDGLLYCGKCRKPKEAYFAPDKAAIFGRDRHPAECDCQRTAREEREAAEKRRRHLDTVEELKRRGFTDPTMRDWTFENDNGRNPQTGLARRYVEHWEDMRTDNIGCLFWGGVGTGKSYLAGCIANALMEKEIPVRMTNFALILNDLAASFEGRNEYISRLCRYPLLILDDFGMERGTEYGLEQVFNVIDSRYRSGKPEKGGGFLVGHGLGFRHNALKDRAPDDQPVAARPAFLLGQLLPQHLFPVFKLPDFLLPVLNLGGHFLTGFLSRFRHGWSLLSARRHGKRAVDFLGCPCEWLIKSCCVLFNK